MTTLPMPTLSLSGIRRRWQEIARTQHLQAVTDALAALLQIDEEIDYSYQESMRAFAEGYDRENVYFPEVDVQAEVRIKLRAQKYQIIASLLSATVNG